MTSRKHPPSSITYNEVLASLHAAANPEWVEQSQSRFGIITTSALGISIPVIRQMAKGIGKNHAIALQLWKTGIHEARLLAAMVAEIEQTDEQLMEKWLHDFNSWDIVDGVCGSLFIHHELAWRKALEWTNRTLEYEKRAGFTLMAGLAVHDKNATNKQFELFFPLIKQHSTDSRNFVKKAVNWALRQIGKRNAYLCKRSLKLAQSILKNHPVTDKTPESRAARWIANDAIRELQIVSDKLNW